MRRTKPDASKPADLRERAERAILTKRGKRSDTSLREMQRLVHDLEVHQIELEMQNEELRRSQLELQAARDRYAELYNFTPAGYVTMDRKGVIQEVNLSASMLMGIPRRELIHQQMIRFVVPNEQVTFAYHCKDVFLTGKKLYCDLRFLGPEGVHRVFHLESRAFPDKMGVLTHCRTALFDITEQKTMAEERDRLASGWRLLLDSTGEGICGIDGEGRFTFINKTGAEMFGYQPEELLGNPMHELVHHHRPDGTLCPREECRVYQAFRIGDSSRVEDEVFWRKDGTTFPVAYSSYPLIERGTITGAVVVFTDVSERKQAEKTLWESEQRFRDLVERLPVAVYVCNVSGVITQFNRDCVAIWGREPKCGDPQVRFNACKIFSPDGTPLPQKDTPMAEVLRSGLAQRNKELVIERPDGSRVTVLVNPIPLWNQAGELTGAVNCMVDITDRKRMEEALVKSDEQFVSFMNNLPGYAWIKNQDGKYIYLNKHFQDTFHLDVAECCGKTDGELFPSATADQFVENDRRVMRTRQLLDTVETFQLDDGVHHGLARKFPIMNKETGELWVGGISIDITDRYRAEEQLQDTLDRLRTLSQRLDAVREEERTHIARELHDELGVRLTCLKLDLARLHALPEGTLFPREKMEEKIVSMTEQVDTTIAELQRLVVELRPGVLDDLGLVAAIEWQSRDFERRSGIRCVCDAAQEEIELDHSCATAAFRICQEALTNVLRHAKATSVRVLLMQENGDLLLEIHDDGQGIPSGKLTDPASFGLMGMRERAGSLGGKVQIAGSPGKGTTVTVRLPRLAAPSLRPPLLQAGMGEGKPAAAASEIDGFAS